MCFFECQLIFCPCDKGKDCAMASRGVKSVHNRPVHKLGTTWCAKENAKLPRVITKPCKLAKAQGSTMGLRTCPDSLREGEFDVITHHVADKVCEDCEILCAARKSERLATRDPKKIKSNKSSSSKGSSSSRTSPKKAKASSRR